MYFNRISSGTILALLAMSGILLLVPIAAPAHAANASLPIINRDYTYVCGGGQECDFNFNMTNPATNQFAITSFTITTPSSAWSISFCDEYTDYLDTCVSGSNQATFTFDTSGFPIPPGGTEDLEIGVNYPVNSTGPYPFTGTFTTQVTDSSSPSFYTGPTTQVISADPAGGKSCGGCVKISGLATAFTAGGSAETITAQLTNGGAHKLPQGGIPIFFTQQSAATYGTFSGSGITCLRQQQCWGYTDSTGKVVATFAPNNKAGSNSFEAVAGGGYFGDGSYCHNGQGITADCNYWYADSAVQTITTLAGAPASVGYQLNGVAFPSSAYLNFQGTTTNVDASAHTYTGAVLCVNTQQSCTGANPSNTAIAISTTDRFGNPDTFAAAPGPGVVTFGAGQNILIQTASGAVFDPNNVATLTGSITCGVTVGFVCPTSGTSFNEPFNYYQGASFGTAGVLTTTITGTYNGGSFSVSGSSGAIVTSTFANGGSFLTTAHAALGATNTVAGKSVTVEFLLNVVQTGVPVTIAVCAHAVCGGTTSKYSGTVSTGQAVSNSTGYVSATLTVDTKAGHVAVLNATVLDPITGTPSNKFIVGPSATITTISGAAAKFSVIVGPTASILLNIANSIPSATVFVNVVTSDAYGNPVLTVGNQQTQINLVSNPNTITASSVYIPTGCAATNATGSGSPSHYTCTGIAGSFGPIAWTLPSTVGSTATISASGVLNGVAVTSATDTINIVSKLPTLSVFSPKPLSGIIYSNSANVQFRGWANASVGYNGAVSMSSLGWKIGSGTWQSTGLAGTNSQWSVIATLPTGLSSIAFNATDSKGNVVVSQTYQVLVDTGAPTVTDVTTAGAVLNPGQLFTATIVDSEGDLNSTYGAAGIQVSYNGTVLPSSAVLVSGTNNPGSSVTYTLTAALPTSVGNPGHWSVVVSAGDLAGNSASSTAELVTVTVAFGNSITFNTAGATYGSVGAYKGVTVTVNNLWSTSQTIVVFATLKSGTSIYVAQGTVTVAAGGSATVFLADLLPVPAGTYTVTFAAVTTSNLAVSAPTTAITVTAT